MSYDWKSPPIRFVGFEDSHGNPEIVNQDDLNQAEVSLHPDDIPREDHKMYDLDWDDPEFEAECVQGFFLSADADLDDPHPSEVFVYTTGPERESPSCYAPVGQHSSGSYQEGDYLISIEDYEAISKGIYTPSVYTCDVVREWDPYKQIRSWK